MIKPAITLHAGLEMVRRGLQGLYEQGADQVALAHFDSLLEDLETEAHNLPHMVCPDQQQVQCRCGAKNTYDCAIVKACGFEDPSMPAAFLMRQAG